MTDATKKRLDDLSKRATRSKSFSEEWQLGEIQAGVAELDAEQGVSHNKVSKWLNSRGKAGETKSFTKSLSKRF